MQHPRRRLGLLSQTLRPLRWRMVQHPQHPPAGPTTQGPQRMYALQQGNLNCPIDRTWDCGHQFDGMNMWAHLACHCSGGIAATRRRCCTCRAARSASSRSGTTAEPVTHVRPLAASRTTSCTVPADPEISECCSGSQPVLASSLQGCARRAACKQPQGCSSRQHHVLMAQQIQAAR